MDGEAADPPRFRIGAQATRELPDRAGESREGAALFGGAWGYSPQPPSAPLPDREADGPPDVGTGRPVLILSKDIWRYE